MTDKEKDLNKELDTFKELLKESMMAMCDYRTMHGVCAKCNDAMFCRAKNVIPKIERALKLKRGSINGR